MAGVAPQATGAPSASSSSTTASSSSIFPPPPPPQKILLAKPASGTSSSRLGRDDDPSAVIIRSRNAPQPGSLTFISDSWDVHVDRILPFLTENTDFTVIGIIGPPGVGKSTIMNELYGFDGNSPGMLPPFATQSDEIRAMAKHCTTGVELRVSSERFILLDTQLGVFLASICNILLVVSEGIHDFNMWEHMLTVDLLKHKIPDPSTLAGSTSVQDKEINGNLGTPSNEHLSTLVFVHTKLRDVELSHSNIMMLRKALLKYFKSSSFKMMEIKNLKDEPKDSSSLSPANNVDGPDLIGTHLILLPQKIHDVLQKPQLQSYHCMIGKLCDQILSMEPRPFAKPVTERDWLRNSAKIWGMVKKSTVIAEYSNTLQDSGLFRK